MYFRNNQAFPLQKIVSGGQTGVDRAALDVCRQRGFPMGGWCPKGRLAEDGALPPHYSLTETPSAYVAQRTEWNVRDADGTLILTSQPPSGGTALTIKFAQAYHKPYLVLRLDRHPDPKTVRDWIAQYEIHTLNVAGPRASSDPTIYHKAYTFLHEMLEHQVGMRGERYEEGRREKL